MMSLQNWLIQQVQCSWFSPWGFRFFLSLCSAILHLFSLYLPQSHKMGMAVPGGASRKVNVSRRRDCLSLPLVPSRLLCSPLPARGMGSPWLAETNQTYPWARKRVAFCEQRKRGNGSRIAISWLWYSSLCHSFCSVFQRWQVVPSWLWNHLHKIFVCLVCPALGHKAFVFVKLFHGR